MPEINFKHILWEKQKEYMREVVNSGNYMSRFTSFQEMFNYFQRGQTVAQIACGSILEDLFHTMEKVGEEGRIILIDTEPDFAYNRALQILGDGFLPNEKGFYFAFCIEKMSYQYTVWNHFMSQG